MKKQVFLRSTVRITVFAKTNRGKNSSNKKLSDVAMTNIDALDDFEVNFISI
jgi:hypothetical protein